MTRLILVVPGPPCGKQRPRMTRTGHTYTPAKTVNAETLIKELFASAYPGHAPWSGPTRLDVRAYFQIPKSTPKKRRVEMENETVAYDHKPDWDNLGKLASDALNGMAQMDDCQVADGRVRKLYSPRPRVEIEIEPLEAS